MIDKEPEIFKVVADTLRTKFKGIYVIGAEMSDAPPKFPAVSFIQTNNVIKTEYATFLSLENVAQEDYKGIFISDMPSPNSPTQAAEV